MPAPTSRRPPRSGSTSTDRPGCSAIDSPGPTATCSPPAGVVAVTNRFTGEFVLELNETAADVLPFVRAARETADGDDASYRIEIDIEGDHLVTYDKETFLVYDHEGNLLRSESLIPSGVEL